MDKQRIEGNWTIVNGRNKEQWGKLTDDDIERIAGERDQLAGAIQRSYGRSLDEARSEVEQWRRASGF